MSDKQETIRNMCAAHSAQVTSSHFSSAEEQWLKQNEPSVRLRVVEDLEGISQGRQSRVSVLAYPVGDTEQQVIWKRMGVRKRLTHDEANAMWRRLDPYKAEIESCGWVVPQLLFSEVVAISEIESQIFSYEQYIAGGDGDLMLSDPREPNFRKWHLISEVLRTLYRYPEERLRCESVAGRTVTCLPHGLDLKAANIVLEAGTDRLHFIDLFGPKELHPSGEWMTYSPKIDPLPAENLRAVCATREGCILRFWRLARRLWQPEHRRRSDLTPELLERLEALGCPTDELQFLRTEIEDGFPWFSQLYSEHHV